MAGQVSICDDGFIVAAALTNGVNRYKAVVLDGTDHEINYGAAVNAAKFIGIAQEDKDAGMTANVRILGNSYAIATGAIAAGDKCVIGDANGGVATAGANTNIIGTALTSAAAAGDMFLLAVNVK